MDQREKAVWDRVLSPGGPGWEPALLWETAALTRAYKRLGLKEAEEAGLRAAALLRGIAALEGIRLRPQQRSPEGPMDLRGCYRRSRVLQWEFALRSGNPETGPVYRQLERLAQAQCLAAAAALGRRG